MRENCTSGSEGGGVEANRLSLPLSPPAAEYARNGGLSPASGLFRPTAHMIRNSETPY
jgi:hypothetical protein